MKLIPIGACFLPLVLPSVAAQDFGNQQVITILADGASAVHTVDLDGDGDAEVLSASIYDGKIAWYQNLGGGAFGPQQAITTLADWAHCVYAADLDGDGDADVLSASRDDDKIAWYKNLGGGGFGPQQVITTAADGARCVYATDLDGDGDADVLSASYDDDKISWYENLGGGAFGPQQVITNLADGANAVHAADVDGDGDPDVLSASWSDARIAWYENLGGGAFGPQRLITMLALGAEDVYTADLDGDGDSDVLSASSADDKIAWYENLGGGVFGPQQVITNLAHGARDVHTADLDGDGDQDVLSASSYDDKIAWYENVGLNNGVDGGAFGPQQVITNRANGAQDVHTADLDGDGNPDVLSASEADDKIAWYENLMEAPDCNGNGIPDWSDIANGTSSDCDDDGIPDECAIADDPSLDQNGNGILDSCECTLVNYCTATPNSSGAVAQIGADGSTSLVDNSLTLTVQGAPPHQFGLFFYGEHHDFQLFGGGFLCVKPPLYRVPAVVQIDAGGAAALALDLGSVPFSSGPGKVVAFSRWNFQFWFRDSLGGPGWFNTSDAIMITFCP